MNNLFPNERLAAAPSKMPAALCEAGLFYIAAIDKEGHLTFTNAYFLKHFSSVNHTSEKTNILDLIHPDDRNHFKNVIGKCLSETCHQTIEIRIINGACHQIKWEITYLEGVSVKAERFLCIGYKTNEHPTNQKSGIW